VNRFILPFLALLAVVVSLVVDRPRTVRALAIAVRRLIGILPSFLTMLALTGLALAAVSPDQISRIMTERSMWAGVVIATAIGSISLMPGFIAFPLSGLLLRNGVPHMVIAAFTVSLMLVGIATFPVERRYFGTRVALSRNLICIGISILVAIGIGIVFGDLQ
jgi:uncharacterized membrane protein YraQ (UPF0718 family)